MRRGTASKPIRRKIFSLACALLLTILATHSGLCVGQDKVSAQPAKLPDKILAFLKPEGEMSKYKAKFTGEVIPIPEHLKETLKWLYLHHFTIVRMKRSLGISYQSLELIIVTDAKSGEVVSYLWQLGAADVPESFKQLLKRYPKETGSIGTENLREMFVIVKALGDLLVYPERPNDRGIGGRVGSLFAEQKGKQIKITAELIRGYIPYRHLVLEIEETELKDRELEFTYGSLSIIDPAPRELR